MLRPYAAFFSKLPDDQKEHGEEIVAPGGQIIMQCLRGRLADRGFTTSEIEQHDSYGWCFEVDVDGSRIWCLLQFCEPWLLITDRNSGLLKRFIGRNDDAAHRKVCETFHEILLSDTSFSGVRWFTKVEFENSKGRGGHKSPV